MKKRRSFSLIELIMVIALMPIIGLILIYFIRNSLVIYQRGQILSNTSSESNDLTSRMTAALRGTFQINTATSTSVVALSYYAPADATPTQVTIQKNTNALSISTITGVFSNNAYVYDPATAKTKTISTHLVTNPATPLFQYYDESNNLLVSPIDVKGVHLMTITSTVFSPLDQTRTQTSSTKIELRNLKTNL